MAITKNFGAEIIGKALVIGTTTSKYVITSVNGNTVLTNFYRTDGVDPLTVPMTTQTLSAMLASGKIHWEDGSNMDAAPEETVTGEAEATVTPEDEVEEVSAEDVGEEPKSAPKSKSKPEAKPKAKRKSTVKKSSPKSGQYIYGEYETKRGKKAPKIMGFNEHDEMYQNAALIGGAKSCEFVKVNGKKMRVYTVIFGTRWCDLAHQLTDALNEGASMDELQDIADAAKEANDQVRAAQKEEYLEKKAERQTAKETKAKAASPSKSAKSVAKEAASKGEKLYTESEVKARIRKAFAVLADAMHVDVKSFEPVIEAA